MSGYKYSPETQAVLDAVAQGNTCPDCGAPNNLQHFDECPRLLAILAMPEDVELSRDAAKMVTALTIRIDCRLCWEGFQGDNQSAHLAYDGHMRKVHPEVQR